MYCHRCGKEVAEDARFCSSCGASLAGGQAPATEEGAPVGPATKALHLFVLFVCIGFGVVLFVGAGLAETQLEEGGQFLGVTIYNFVLGAGFITSAVLFMARHRRAPYLAGVTAFLYVVCTVVNEMVQLAHGQDMLGIHQRLTPVKAAWDILFWSFFPALVVIFSILVIRMQARSAGAAEGTSS